MMESNSDEKAALRLGRNKNTSADVLKTIVGHSDKVDRLIVKHPNADGAVLSGLSGSNDKTTIKYLLLNSNTSSETILAIASMCPDGCREILCDFFKNPDHEALAIRLAKDKKISEQALYMLLGLYPSVDRLIAKHPNAEGRDIFDELSESKDKTTRRNVFFNQNASDFTIIKLVPDFPDDFLKLKPQVLDKLVSKKPQYIYDIGQALLTRILMHRKCPQTLLHWAYKHGSAHEQLAVWRNPSTTVELLTEMMETGYPQEANVLLAHPAKILEFVSDLGLVGSPPNSYEELCEYGGWLRDTSDRVSDLWKKLVPKEGEAETIQGEMVRAIGRIKGDYYKNGFGNWYSYYYDLSQFLAVHLADESTFNPFTVNILRADIRALHACGLRCMHMDDLEQTFLDSINDEEEIFLRLDAAIVVWCERHPEPIPYNRSN